MGALCQATVQRVEEARAEQLTPTCLLLLRL